MKIKQLLDNIIIVEKLKKELTNFDIKVFIKQIFETRTVKTKFGNKIVCELIVGVETETMNLIIWEQVTNKMHVGDLLFIKNVSYNIWQGTPQIVIGNFSQIEIIKPKVEDSETKSNIKDKIPLTRTKAFGFDDDQIIDNDSRNFTLNIMADKKKAYKLGKMRKDAYDSI